MLPTKFQVNRTFNSGEAKKKKKNQYFRDGGHGGHLGFPIGTVLVIFFFIYKSPRCFLPSLKSIGLSFQKMKRKIDFQAGGHLGNPIGSSSSHLVQ